MHLSVGRLVKDHAGSYEAKARDDALDDARYIRLPVMRDSQNRECRSNRHQPQGPHAGGLVMQIAVESDYSADQDGGPKAHDNVEPVHRKALRAAFRQALARLHLLRRARPTTIRTARD